MNFKANENRKRYWMAALVVVLALAWTTTMQAQDPLRVSEVIARQAVTAKEPPEYPAMARQMKVVGKVTVEAVIDTEGKVEDCKPVVGNALLTGAAVNAVKKWTFKPFTAGDKPTKAVTQLTFAFGV